jgi:sarcosine oxidase delta subunit
MTGTYEWNPMPYQLDVVCPVCLHRAEFEFAEVVRIKLKSDVEFFQKSSMFEYQEFQDSCGHAWHGALYFQGLHGSPCKAIHELPVGYSAEAWEHSRYLRSHSDWRVGSMRCAYCGARGKHTLNWPEDAYFSIALRGHVLWAFHRESTIELVQYVLSTERDISRYRWPSFLLHVPSVFKVRKAREAVVKQLSKLLDAEHGGQRTPG